MGEALDALADVHRWLCDNLSKGNAGKVCGMLSVVSRHISRLEAENAKLRKLVKAFDWCTENFDIRDKCDKCPLRQSDSLEPECEVLMRELGIKEG